MARKKKVTNSKLALLNQIQDRVTQVSATVDQNLYDARAAFAVHRAEINQTHDKLSKLRNDVDRAWNVQDSRETIASKNRAEIESYAKNTTASLYALREQVQKAFTRVANDIDLLRNQLNGLSIRLTALEISKNQDQEVPVVEKKKSKRKKKK